MTINRKFARISRQHYARRTQRLDAITGALVYFVAALCLAMSIASVAMRSDAIGSYVYTYGSHQ